jgi:hypothetical protein
MKKKDNPVPSLDNKLTEQEKEFIIEGIEAANDYCEGYAFDNDKKNKEFIKSVKNKLQNGVETNKSQPKMCKFRSWRTCKG